MTGRLDELKEELETVQRENERIKQEYSSKSDVVRVVQSMILGIKNGVFLDVLNEKEEEMENELRSLRDRIDAIGERIVAIEEGCNKKAEKISRPKRNAPKPRCDCYVYDFK